jgi:hypothetical protein
MAKLTVQQIRHRLREVLEASPKGVRWMQMHSLVGSEHPETPENTIHGTIQRLVSADPDILKVARGTYVLRKYQEAAASETSEGTDAESVEIPVKTAAGETVTITETNLYEPFAEWLRDELEEVNEALTLGGNILRGKWGTPDVIGVLKPRAYDPIKFETQFVSAEIKIDPFQPIVAFGQAIAYRLFSHKSYIVMPDSISEDDLNRLEALSILYGLGFVTFALHKETPDFTLQVRASAAKPDMFYLNQVARRILEYSKDDYERLFG